METLYQFFQYVTHIDVYLLSFVSTHGSWTYVVLFLIIFCETGLVITPFLPGDSLLFAAGTITANPESDLNIQLLTFTLLLAAMLGNKSNYLIGKNFGTRLFQGKSRLFNRKYLQDTQTFYAKHGGKTIILARFIPIIRTFAPFVAGLSRMRLQEFTFYNAISALLWVGSLTMAGYLFGNIPAVKEHFSMVVYGIIVVSLIPAVFTFLLHKVRKHSKAAN